MSLHSLISIDVASQNKLKGGTNYSSWRRQFHSLLVGHELQGFIDGTNRRPTSALDHQRWIQQDQLLFHAILASVEEETVAPLIVSSPSARDAWLSLERLFASRSRSHHMELMNKLSHLTHDKNQSVSVFLTSLKRVANDLALVGHPVDDDDLVLYALNGVGSEFNEIVAAIRARDYDDVIAFEELFDELVEFETFMERKGRGGIVVCQFCDEPGHSAKTCRRISQAQHHFIDGQTTASTAITTNPNGSASSSWLFDSAATQHITNAFRNLTLPQLYDGHNTLINIDGSEINFTNGALRVVALLLQPILLLYKLLFGRTNILNTSSQQFDANIIPSLVSVPPTSSNFRDHKQDVPNNTIPQQSYDNNTTSTTTTTDNSDLVSPLPRGEYEVFLSFRGPDTRQVFTSTLSTMLKNLKIRAFMDDEKLEKGEEIWPGLVTAIERSKIHVAVLSEKYADSKWCLRELAKFIECRKQNKGHILIPIFYMMDPRDVRHQTGPYESAFRQHKNKFDAKTVQAWRDALNEVGTIKGWNVGSKDKPAEIANKVCNDIWLHIMKNDKILGKDEVVGFDEHKKVVIDKLSLGSEGVTMVGLHGFGGIGKTTMARYVYLELGDKFDRHCFLENIRKTQEDDKDGTIKLQKKLISQVMRRKDIASIDSVEEGRKIIQDRVTHFKVLIVLDDVDEKFKFKDILGDPKHFVSGSRFIITSRNVQVLISFNENRCKLHEVEPMDPESSFQLFCKHAFVGNTPQPGFKTLAEKIVEKIAGVPLALKVVGSSLLREEKSFWEDTLAKLGKIPEKEITQTLRISYDQLDHGPQQIFLDIACFYVGINKNVASYMWSDLELYPEREINILVQRSLIKIGANDEFQVHDLLRDMGRTIVREENIEDPWMRSRIWDEKEALELLQSKKGSDKVKALRLEDKYENGKLTCEHFVNLSELRYFQAQGVAFEGDFNNVLPNIRWLCLPEHENKGCYPTNFQMTKLVVLDLEGSINLTSEWGGWSQIKTAKKLNILDLYGCSSLTRLPNFPQSGSLKVLDLTDVSNLDPGVELNLGDLRKLKELYLNNVKLKRMSGGTIGAMKKLHVLDLSGFECDNLKEVLVDIGTLSSLKTLKTCTLLTDQLQDKDEPMPSDIEELLEDKKEIMDIHAHYGKEAVPLGKLPTSLKELVTSSPVVNLSELLEMEKLAVEDCDDPGLQIPPVEDSWWIESKLKRMVLIHTKIASSSNSRLPSSLKTLFIWDCLESESLPTMENLENLIHLGFIGCNHIQEIHGLESLFQFNKLESLHIASCPLLTSTFNKAAFVINSSLKNLYIHNCGGGIPRLSNFPKLVWLEIGRIIVGDDELEEIGQLTELGSLILYELESVERLPSLSSLVKLHVVCIIDTPRLREIEGLAELKWLERLVLAGCTALEGLKLPPPAKLKLLKELDIRGCENLPSSDVHALEADYANHLQRYNGILKRSVELHEDGSDESDESDGSDESDEWSSST